jgi:hypothetical protein
MSCNAPIQITDDLLRAEGFTDIRYVPVKTGLPYSQAFARGEIDFSMMFASGAVRRIDSGTPITVLAGVHPGCFGLFVHEHIRTFTDLKGRQVGVKDGLGSARHQYVSIMAAYSRAKLMRIWLSCRNLLNCAPARSVARLSIWQWTGPGPSTSAVFWRETRTLSGSIQSRPNGWCAPS